MNRTLLLALLCVWLLQSCSSDKLSDPLDQKLRKVLNQTSPTGDYNYYILPESNNLANIPQDPRNELTAGKIALGKMLFFETGLALDPTYEFSEEFYSCASCHIPAVGFMPGRVQGIADGGIGFGENGEMRDRTILYQEDELDVQGARALSLVNVAYTTNTSWNGMFGGGDVNEGTEELWDLNELLEVNHLGFSGMETQIIEGLHLHRMIVNPEVISSLGYKEIYDQCFPFMEEEERYGEIATSLALAAYLRSLISNEAPFQSWLKGDETALSDAEKRGGQLFFGKAGCFRCHSSPALNNADNFYALGVSDLYETGEAFNTGPDDERNFGRGFFTKKEEDMHKFKVPQLYNVADGTHFFHGSSKTTMRDVVRYFNLGVPENSTVPAENIASQFHPLNMTEGEVDDLVLFLEKSLVDEDIERYAPESILSGNCFPNNDPASRVALGCE